MKELISVILKELNLIRTQRAALALILIYPLLIISALGLAFGMQTEITNVDVGVYIPNKLGLLEFDRQTLIQMIADTNKVNPIVVPSKNDVIELIKERRTKMGLVVREQKSEDGQLLIDLYIDNTNPVVLGIFSPIAKTTIQLTAFEISSATIEELWSSLKATRQSVMGEIENVDSYLEELEQAEQNLLNLEETMGGIDLNNTSELLHKQRGNIDSTESILAEFKQDYHNFKDDINATRQEIYKAEETLASYKEKVSTQKDLLGDYYEDIVSLENDIQQMIDETPEASKPALIAIKNDVASVRIQLEGSINELERVESDIETSEQQLSIMKTKISEAERRLDKEKASIDGLEITLTQATGDINEVNSQLSSMEQTIQEVELLIDEAKQSKKNVSSKLENSKKMFSNFKETLVELDCFSPKFLSHPLWAFEKKVFPSITTLSFITPISIAIVLLLTGMLLTASTIVVERKEGSHLRMKMSSTNPVVLVLGKIIGQIILGFLVASIILVLALIKIPLPSNVPFLGTDYIGFGAQFFINPIDLVLTILLVSVSFIALGLFITNFAKTESTAILLSLIVMLPMIFLSGTILPIEFMSPVIQMVSPYLPLTLANTLLSEVLVKGTALSSLLLETGILALMSLALIIYSIVKY